MRILIAAMAAMAQTSGCMSRAAAMCNELLLKGHELAFCMAEDVNYKPIQGIKNYYAPVPSPLGLLMMLGERLFKIAQTLGVQQRKPVNSFEEVLQFTGANSREYFEKDLSCLRQAIRDFKPDIVYSEFRLSAIAAAKLENVTVAATVSYPTQTSFACNPEYSKKTRALLQSYGLPPTSSILDIFQWADIKFVPSSFELEPFNDDSVIFVGPFTKPREFEHCNYRKAIAAYMGNGTITTKKVIKELETAFRGSSYDVYIASADTTPRQIDNLTIDKYFDFSKLLPQALAYINHGGQNSIMTGLLYGVPQIICAGNVFERKYNAESIVKLNAGVSIKPREFTAEILKGIVEDFERNDSYRTNSLKHGKSIVELGGVEKLVRSLEQYMAV